MASDKFYDQLETFKDFQKITDLSIYKEIPEDWAIFITDICGSTKAIEEGRYKEVNTVGAASIVCTQNAMDGQDFPYVFGGDGATLLVPPSQIEAVSRELHALKILSEENFSLDLRVTKVLVGELNSDKDSVRVAKFEFVENRAVAVFQGGGLTLAEKMIKDDPEKYKVEVENPPEPDLTGLSCRWQPIPNKKGKVLSLLVMAQNSKDSSVYDKVLEKMSHIFSGELDDANPVNVDQMTYRSAKQVIKDEKRYHADRLSLSYFLRYLEILFAVLVFKFKVNPVAFKPKEYANSMRTHSDYRKFDDMLRMVVDCSDEQHEAIEKYFRELHNKGEIFYGLHESEESLMTCFVHQITDGNHIHFIDGANGGYAMAAKQMKQQIKELIEFGVAA